MGILAAGYAEPAVLSCGCGRPPGFISYRRSRGCPRPCAATPPPQKGPGAHEFQLAHGAALGAGPDQEDGISRDPGSSGTPTRRREHKWAQGDQEDCWRECAGRTEVPRSARQARSATARALAISNVRLRVLLPRVMRSEGESLAVAGPGDMQRHPDGLGRVLSTPRGTPRIGQGGVGTTSLSISCCSVSRVIVRGTFSEATASMSSSRPLARSCASLNWASRRLPRCRVT
jgi:hypothetical protein